MKLSLTTITTGSDPADIVVSSASLKHRAPRVAHRSQHCRLSAVMSIELPTIVSIFLVTLTFCGCTKAEQATRKATLQVERQLSFPEIHIQPRAITTDKDGNVVVVGSNVKQAFAMASDRYGTVLWQYPRTPDGRGGSESSFAGAIPLDGGNYLLCGYKSGPNNPVGWIVILDPQGSVVEERTMLPEGGVQFLKGDFSGCIKRPSGILLSGLTYQNDRGMFWIVNLDSKGKAIRDLVVRDYVAGDMAVSADGSLTLSRFDSGRLQMELVRMTSSGEITAKREIKGFGSVLFRGVDSAGLVQAIVYGVGNQATLHVLNEQLQDAKPVGPPLDFDARKSCSFTLPNGGALMFGRTSNAAAALIGPQGAIIGKLTFDSKFQSFAVDDATAVSATEFVTVTNSVSVDPKYQGLVISWIKLGD
jgi:hypothetical protein